KALCPPTKIGGHRHFYSFINRVRIKKKGNAVLRFGVGLTVARPLCFKSSCRTDLVTSIGGISDDRSFGHMASTAGGFQVPSVMAGLPQ
ncbi:hypothetical protein, partial [[Mycobacterium] zoologicum]|uniref:hypothetical protein n=1 Tax=[Mycobacterium] zoologicum TaxID=2872311 RepID=UPI002CDB8C5C